MPDAIFIGTSEWTLLQTSTLWSGTIPKAIGTTGAQAQLALSSASIHPCPLQVSGAANYPLTVQPNARDGK